MLGYEKDLAEVGSQVKKLIEDQDGSEGNLIQRPLEVEEVEVLKLFKPEYMRSLTPKQIRGLTHVLHLLVRMNFQL